jgi:outer membrane protein assembly factor BamB
MRISDLVLLASCLLSPALLADWPQFRGSDGQGHSDAAGIPVHWSEEKNVTWKVPVPGEGWSSPVVAGDQIWMTTATEKGTSLRAICVDRRDGKLVHNIDVLRPAKAGRHHAENGFASPTPVLDGKHVFAHFGPRGTVCLNTKGEIVWKNTEFKYDAYQGAGSSPILHGDLLILTCDGTDNQFLAALDKKSGDVVWKQPRAHLEAAANKGPIAKMAYSTPLVQMIDGVEQLVSSGADHVAAYDVKTGRELWWMSYDGFSIVARPSFGNGLVYVGGSVRQDQHAVYAIRPGAKGQVKEDQVVWQRSIGIPHVPSPLLVGKELFVVHDGGVATCVDALTGDEHWRERLGGKFRASPIEVRGRIYAFNQQGKGFVLEAGKEFNVIATNELDGTFYASPAIADGALFLRSKTHLYRIEEK